jgi:hypothetical protein
MNTYLETLTPAAETAIWPLERKATALAKQLAAIQHRAAAEQESIIEAEARLEELKADAGQRLSESAQSYGRFKSELRVLTARLETSRETVRMFSAELIPAKTRELDEARRAVEDGLITFVAANLVDCERRMGELLGAVLEERDAFMAATDAIATRFMGCVLAGSRRAYPEPMHLRPDVYRKAMLVATTLNESIFDSDAPRRRGAFLTPPPVAETATEARQTAQDAPGATPTGTPDAQDGQGNPQDARDTARTRETGRQIDADGQTRPKCHTLLTGDAGAAETGPDFLSGKPAARDYPPDAELDAEIEVPPVPSETAQAADPLAP